MSCSVAVKDLLRPRPPLAVSTVGQRGLQRLAQLPPFLRRRIGRHHCHVAGEIRAGIILWQQPVANDSEARRIVIEASRKRGMAFAASGRGDHAAARVLRFGAALLEARLIDPLWRETAAELLRLPQAA